MILILLSLMIMQSFSAFQAILNKRLTDAEQTIDELRSIGAAKGKRISQLEKEVNSLEKQVMVTEMEVNKVQMEAVEDAKVCAARVILKAKITMAQQAMDPSFDRSEWDLAGWKERLQELGGYETPGEDPLPILEEGPSGTKDEAEDAGAKGEAGGDGGDAGGDGRDAGGDGAK